ncbi:MAG: hypothetical protein IJO87_01090 [Eggerthellaceae bacterium]|nr:hypothetical protein [Eggerthellaceae bacterium]
MDITHDDIVALIQLQQLDLELMRQRKELDELPQRAVILEARQKKAAIAEKQAKVAGLKRDVSRKVTRINDEDSSLAKKQQGTEAAIAAAKGEYRNVEARTKELASITRRREDIASDLDKVLEELAKIEDLEAQIALALEDVDAREQAAVASFKEQGGALKLAIMKQEAERERMVAGLGKQVVSAYQKAAARSGGVAIGRLDGARCGVCRTGIEGGRLIELKAQAPLGTCPNCKRLLIIE